MSLLRAAQVRQASDSNNGCGAVFAAHADAAQARCGGRYGAAFGRRIHGRVSVE